MGSSKVEGMVKKLSKMLTPDVFDQIMRLKRNLREQRNSLSFPGNFQGIFKSFPEQLEEKKIRWNTFLLAIMSRILRFPCIF